MSENKSYTKMNGQGGNSTIIINDTEKTDFNVNRNASDNITNSSLNPEEAIKLRGTFIPKTLGNRRLLTTLNFKEGTAITLATETEVVQVLLKILLDPGTDKLTKIPINSAQNIIFYINNNSGLDATVIKIKDIYLLEDVTIVEEKPDKDGKYLKLEEPISLEEFNKKDTNKLDSNHRYCVTAKLKTDQAGLKFFGMLVTFDELKTLVANDENRNGVKFTKDIALISIPIRGEVTKKLPHKIKLGQSSEVIFSFTNQSTEFSATKVQLEVKQEETI